MSLKMGVVVQGCGSLVIESPAGATQSLSFSLSFILQHIIIYSTLHKQLYAARAGKQIQSFMVLLNIWIVWTKIFSHNSSW